MSTELHQMQDDDDAGCGGCGGDEVEEKVWISF